MVVAYHCGEEECRVRVKGQSFGEDENVLGMGVGVAV